MVEGWKSEGIGLWIQILQVLFAIYNVYELNIIQLVLVILNFFRHFDIEAIG